MVATIRGFAGRNRESPPKVANRGGARDTLQRLDTAPAESADNSPSAETSDSVAIPSARRSAAVAERALQLVEMLTPVLAAGGIDGTLRVARSHPLQRQRGDAGVGLLRDP